MLPGVVNNLTETSLTIYNFMKINEEIVKSVFVLIFSLGLSKYITNYKIKSHSKKFKALLRPISSYCFFWSTSAATRKNLMTLFILALSYLIFLRSLGFAVIENVSYSIVAAFIFDAFLNYHQENEKKKQVVMEWGYKLDEHRLKWEDFLRLKSKLKFQGLDSELIHQMVYSNANLVNELPIDDVIYDFQDYLPVKLTISNGNDLTAYAKALINSDARFISSFYKDASIFVSFPNMKASSYPYHQFCILTNMSINGSSEPSDPKEMLKTLIDCKNDFSASISENIGLYRQV